MTINFDKSDIDYWHIYRGNKQQLVGWFRRESNEPYKFESFNGVIFNEIEIIKILSKMIELNEELTVYV